MTKNLISCALFVLLTLHSSAFCQDLQTIERPRQAEITEADSFSSLLSQIIAKSADQETVDKYAVYEVTDHKRGITITLENINGYTLITELETGEKVIEKGEFAHLLSDETYESLLSLKSKNRITESVHKSLTATGRWTSQDQQWDYESPSYYLTGDLSRVIVEVDGSCYVERANAHVYLMQVRNYWFDLEYGHFSFFIDNKEHTYNYGNERWVNVPMGKSYYIKIYHDGQPGTSAWGGWEIVSY